MHALADADKVCPRMVYRDGKVRAESRPTAEYAALHVEKGIGVAKCSIDGAKHLYIAADNFHVKLRSNSNRRQSVLALLA